MRRSGVFVTFAALWLCGSGSLPAQTFTTVLTFNASNGGSHPLGLVQATDGKIYGTTQSSDGTIFKITPSGTLTKLFSFNGLNDDGGASPAGLIQGTDGNFYGTTSEGGANGDGTVFKITPGGTLTTLHSFDFTDGSSPAAGLIQGTDGNFYGTTQFGGANSCVDDDGTVFSCGTIFKITPSGTLTTLHRFGAVESFGVSTDGELPEAALVQGADGNFYGTTNEGGTNYACDNGCGTVFKITPGGTFTTLNSFLGYPADGINPLAGVIQGTDGNFYGTNSSGGGVNFDGTVFKITPSGTLTVLHSFDGTDGSGPGAALVQATDGNFYGTTLSGGANGYGTVFQMTPSGTLTTLHSFDNTDGRNPNALIQDTSGTLYGTTARGASSTREYRCTGVCGTVFSLSVDLGPFIETQPDSGAVGVAVNILGTSLTGATSVTFSGTAASFTVASSSEITTTVPGGATTGEVKVVTPSGTLSSKVPFRVP